MFKRRVRLNLYWSIGGVADGSGQRLRAAKPPVNAESPAQL
jgi:hypothetical protein